MLAQALPVRSAVVLELGRSEGMSSAAAAPLLLPLGVGVALGMAKGVGDNSAPTTLALVLALRP